MKNDNEGIFSKLVNFGRDVAYEFIGKRHCPVCEKAVSIFWQELQCGCCLKSFDMICVDCARKEFVSIELSSKVFVCQQCDLMYREQAKSLIVTDKGCVDGHTIKESYAEISSEPFSIYTDHQIAQSLLKYNAIRCGANAIINFQTITEEVKTATHEPGVITIEDEVRTRFKGTPVKIEKKLQQKVFDGIKGLFIK